ncbi:MAG TPA: COX15/CtaA family protein, partial [Verrucomicrobiae bacterium]|nr:COX15/CtaA family protein [Verrucomicrobiae bacterium]
MRWLGALAFALVALQGVLGGLRVTWDMDKLGIVHGALAQLFFVLICALALFTSRWWSSVAAVCDRRSNSETNATVADRRYETLRWLVLAATILIFLQLILGATMRHQHAGLAIPDFPAAYGKIWPDTSAAAVAHYNANRMNVVAENPITAFQIILQMVHRMVALTIFMGVAVCAWRAWRELGKRDALARLALFWLALIAVQIALGALTIWSNKAADVATAHVLVGALSLVTGALWCATAFHRFGPVSRVEPAGIVSGTFGVRPAMVGNK